MVVNHVNSISVGFSLEVYILSFAASVARSPLTIVASCQVRERKESSVDHITSKENVPTFHVFDILVAVDRFFGRDALTHRLMDLR